jgi:hypothetical protein
MANRVGAENGVGYRFRLLAPPTFTKCLRRNALHIKHLEIDGAILIAYHAAMSPPLIRALPITLLILCLSQGCTNTASHPSTEAPRIPASATTAPAD